MKSRWIRMIILTLLVFVTSNTLVFAEQTKPNSLPLPQEKVQQNTFNGGVFWNKTVQFANGDLYWMKRFEFQKSNPLNYSFSFTLPGKDGHFRYVEPIALPNGNVDRVWKQVPLTGELPRTYGFIETDQKQMLISFPDVYKQSLHNTLQETAHLAHPISVKTVPGGYKFTVEFSQEAGTIGEIWALQSSEHLVEWQHQDLEKIWLLLDLHDDQKWSWDGFYVLSPSNYYPTGQRLFWRIPENYIARSFVMTGGSRAAYDLGWVMLKTILPEQNQYGFWPSLPESQWLKEDYGIEAGFYDTRFNTDMGSILLKATLLYQDSSFQQANQRYAEFLLMHSQKHHTVVEGKQEGWLVADYANYEKPQHLESHTSLNHQLQEINYLYEMYFSTKDKRFLDLANKMLLGIKNIGDLWCKPNGDLHYAYLPSGQMGLPDYPYLTYNDLWQTQLYLIQLNGSVDSDLRELMENKRRWMDSKGITGYRKELLE
ncbi:hypothetical protein ACQCN2_01655 [Brevibacillus ginsengisoli]|uniref:hypothetical protein n=1 Tax=Brevibacillus ginsengisoli TaxID=363854 RepID=UPI003CE9E76C